MKINKYIGWAVCSMLMASCQSDDTLENPSQDSEVYTLIGQINNEDPESRAQIELGCQETWVEYFFWNEGDHFTLYQNLNNELVASDFVISEDYSESNGGAQSAEFSSTTALTPLASYTAVYPSPTTVTDKKVRLEIQREVDFASATTDEQRAEVWKNYFTENMFMVASGTVSESGRNYVQFNHLTTLARITYVNQTGSRQLIDGVRLSGQNFGTYMNYDLVNNREAGSGSSSAYTLTTTGLTVEDKDTVDLYFFFFPKAIEQTDLEISIQQSAGNKTLSLPWKDILAANGNNASFRAGMRYWFDVTDTAKGLEWTKNTAEEGWIVFENEEFSDALYEMLGNYKVLMTEEGFAKITENHVNSVYELDFSDIESEVTTLDGIEHFRNLQTLKCNNFGLEMDTLDLSMLASLRHLELAGNNLKALKLPADTWSMNYLDCHDNKIDSLDITGLKNIEYGGTLICGLQKDNISLKLVMTNSQKNKWESDWMNHELNEDVIYEDMSLEAEMKLVAKNGGTFTLTESIRLTSPLVVEKDMTIDLGSEYYIGAISDGFSDPKGLQTLIAVKPGATLTITANGMNGQINTGESDVQRSAIRLIKGDDNASGNKARLVVNGGWIVARYYGILVDKDCPDSEIIIDTNDRIQGDFRNEANGTGILNLNNNGKVVVEKGTVMGNASAIEMRGGTLEVKNGELISEYTGETTNRNKEDENTVIGAAVAISPISENSVSVTINGGQFKSNSTYSLYQIYMGGKPENANVNMSVIGGTFEKDITSENCTGFISGGRYKVQPNANYMVNGKIAVSTGDYYEIQDGEPVNDLITIQNAELSTALKAVLGAENVTLDDNGYAVMTKEFAESVETIEIPSRKYTITSLSGIEYFTNLKRLQCAGSGLTECNLSKNTALESVAVWGNSLTTLDLSNQASLSKINCAQNETLKTLTINGNVKLKYLIIDDTQLQSFAIPNPQTIWQLAYSRTSLDLDLSEFTGLGVLNCSGNSLSSINLTTETKKNLIVLECESNKLTALNLSEYPNLQSLNCVNNQLTSLDLSTSSKLTSLRCSKNQMTSISVNHLTNLEELDIIDNQLTSLDVSSLTNLRALFCFGNHLSSLDLIANTLLEAMQLGNQTDVKGNDIYLELKLADNVKEIWFDKWESNEFNERVNLYTGPSVEAGDGNTGGSDFTIEGIY